MSNFGDSALFLTLAIWAKDLTGSSSAAGLVFFFLAAPVLASPLFGHLADRVRRRPLLVTVNALAGVGVLCLLLVRDAGDLWLLYVVAAGYGVVGYVTAAARSGLLRDLLTDDQLDTANGTLMTIDQGLRIMSPLVGAGLYAAFGGPALAVLAAASFGAAVVALLSVRVTESEPTPPQERESFGRELSAGFRHVRAVPAVFRITVALAVSMLVIGLADSALFSVVDDGLGLDPEFFGVLMSAQGAGSIAGGLVSVWLLRRLGGQRLVGIGLAVLAVGGAAAAGADAVGGAGRLRAVRRRDPVDVRAGGDRAAADDAVAAAGPHLVRGEHGRHPAADGVDRRGRGARGRRRLPLAARADGAGPRALRAAAAPAPTRPRDARGRGAPAGARPDRNAGSGGPVGTGMTTITGEYAPSTSAWVRKQVDTIEETGTTTSVHIQHRPVVLLTMRGKASGKVRKVPLMRVEHEGVYAAVASKGGAPGPPAVVLQPAGPPRPRPAGRHRGDGRCGPARSPAPSASSGGPAAWRRSRPTPSTRTKTDRLIPVFLLEPR